MLSSSCWGTLTAGDFHLDETAVICGFGAEPSIVTSTSLSPRLISSSQINFVKSARVFFSIGSLAQKRPVGQLRICFLFRA
jgi:hypothetical protein